MTADHADIDPARYVVGRRAVMESLQSGNPLEKIFVSYGADDGPLGTIRAQAKRSSVQCSVMDRRKFQALERALNVGANDAQGVIALRPIREATTLAALLAYVHGEPPLIVALDGIMDPHNLGAIARSAEGAGAKGLILPEKFGSPITPTAVKASAGALEHLPSAKVLRMSEALETAKKAGFTIIGAASPGTVHYRKADYRGPCIIVLGNEGEGLHPRVQQICSQLVEIPMSGQIASLNASVAAGIILFEAQAQRA